MKGWKARFFTIWAGQQGSLFGSHIVQFALVWWLTQKTGSATVLATATLVAMLPQIFVGPFSGALVDRLPRRWVMVVADSAIALVSLALVYLFWSGGIRVWHIYLAMALRSVGGGFHWPAMAATTPLMVPEKHLTRVAGLNQAMNGALNVVSPPLGALFLSLFPMYGVVGTDVLTALLAVAPLLFIPVPQPARAEGEKTSYLADLKAGFRYVWAWKGLLYLMMFATLINFVANPAFSLLPLFVKDHLGGGAMELGWLESAWGVGMVAGGLLLSVWGGFRRRIFTALTGVLGMGAAILGVGFLPPGWLYAALGLFLLAGLMNPIANGPLMAILQARVSPEVQGRVFSLLSSMVTAISPLSLAVAGPVADLVGIRPMYAIAGAGMVLLGIAALASPPVRDVEA
ncbi:MAG: Multidrug resistance protein [Acetothermia bacterium 64_32]|nr:MAG: Multidrug resistance protein [Acetothermia bacterium 64_32]HAF70097.1 MFS transporter [Candidatus Acetothermia bacterium]